MIDEKVKEENKDPFIQDLLENLKKEDEVTKSTGKSFSERLIDAGFPKNHDAYMWMGRHRIIKGDFPGKKRIAPPISWQ